MKTLIALASQVKECDLLNKKQQTPLMLAVINEHQRSAQWLLEQKADPDRMDAYSQSARDYSKTTNLKLVYNRQQQTKQVAKQQLSKQQWQHQLKALRLLSTTTDSPYFNWPDLLIATAQKQTQLSSYLLQQGRDPWQTNPSGDTAISLALLNDQGKLAKKMLTKHKIDDKKNTNSVKSLFLLAIEKNQLQLVKQLLSGPKVANLLKLKQDALKKAIDCDNLPIARFLLSSLRKKPSNDLLHYSINKENTLFSKLLINNGVKLDWRDKNGNTPLLVAAQQGNHQVIQLLLDKKVDIKSEDNNKQTALMKATQNNCLQCVEILLAKQADPEKQSINGNNSVMFAAQNSHQVLERFLRQDPDLSKRNKQNLTALMIAVTSGCLECTKTLLDFGANPRRKNSRGQNSYDLASTKPEILALLEEY